MYLANSHPISYHHIFSFRIFKNLDRQLSAISPQCRPLKDVAWKLPGKLIHGVEETSLILLMVQKSGEKTSWGSRLVVKIPLFTRYWHHPRWFWSPDFWVPSTVPPENHGIPKAARSKTSVDWKYLDGWWHPVFLIWKDLIPIPWEKKNAGNKKNTCNFAEFRSHQKLVLFFGHQLSVRRTCFLWNLSNSHQTHTTKTPAFTMNIIEYPGVVLNPKKIKS